MGISKERFYDLGAAPRPFRVRVGSEVVITGVHKESSLSPHYVGMRATVLASYRRHREKSTNLVWVTAKLRLHTEDRKEVTFSLVRFKAAEPSRSTLYRRGVLGNGGEARTEAVVATAIMVLICVFLLYGLHIYVRDTRVLLITQLQNIQEDTRVIEQELRGLNQNLANLGVLPKK